MPQFLRFPVQVKPMFTRPKGTSPIQITSAPLGDLLIDASLDPAVRRLEKIPELFIDGTVRFAASAVVAFEPSRCVIEIVPSAKDGDE